MRTRRRAVIVVLLLALAAAGWLALVPRSSPEPEYKGRSLGVWLKEFDHWGGDTNAPVVLALREMGTNAIPTLVKMSLTPRTPLRSRLWWTINSRASLKNRFGEHEITTAEKLRFRAGDALSTIGPAARGAVPLLLKELANKDPYVRATAVIALGKTGSQAEDTIPTLLALQNDPSSAVRGNLMIALGWIGCRAETCHPVLTNGLSDQDAVVRQNAAIALAHFGRFGPGGALLR